jgi:hypothetical protein
MMEHKPNVSVMNKIHEFIIMWYWLKLEAADNSLHILLV